MMMMNIHSNISETIKSLITMQDIADKYSLTPNRAGFISCPLHGEKTPSLRIYPNDRGWYCFGCGKGGDVIKFVQHFFNISFPAALVRINTDFSLNLTTERADPKEVERLRRKRREKEAAERTRNAQLNQMAKEYCDVWTALKTVTDGEQKAALLARLEYLEHRLEG